MQRPGSAFRMFSESSLVASESLADLRCCPPEIPQHVDVEMDINGGDHGVDDFRVGSYLFGYRSSVVTFLIIGLL